MLNEWACHDLIDGVVLSRRVHALLFCWTCIKRASPWFIRRGKGQEKTGNNEINKSLRCVVNKSKDSTKMLSMGRLKGKIDGACATVVFCHH